MSDIPAERDLTFSIARLELERGDVLVVKAEIQLREVYQRTISMFRSLVPDGVKVLFIPPNVELSVLTKAEIDEKSV